MSKKKYDLENFPILCRKLKLPLPLPEHRFHPERRWRFDWIFPGKIALEINGGNFFGGRHSRGAGILKDYEKLNVAQSMGWIVLQVTPAQIGNGEFAKIVRAAIDYRMAVEAEWKENDVVSIPGHVLSERFGVDMIEPQF